MNAPAYPDICFAIDEFDETHQHMVGKQTTPQLCGLCANMTLPLQL